MCKQQLELARFGWLYFVYHTKLYNSLVVMDVFSVEKIDIVS